VAVAFARSGEVFDVRPLGPALADWETAALLETGGQEVVRLIVPQSDEIPTHKSHGDVAVQCVEGLVAFTAGGVARAVGRPTSLPSRGAVTLRPWHRRCISPHDDRPSSRLSSVAATTG